MNFIRGALGEILFKKQKKDLFNNQQIVANSISKNKLQNLSEEKKIEKNDKIDLTEITKDLFYKVRSIYDFKALNERYKNKKIYNFYCPTEEYKKKLFDIICAGRFLRLGFEEFVGCKKNIKKNINNPNIFFDFTLDKKSAFLLKTIISIFEGKNIDSKKLDFFFPELNINDLVELNKLILSEELYFIKANEIIKKIKIISEEESSNNLKNDDQIKSKDNKSKKEDLKKILLNEKINKKQKSKPTEVDPENKILKKKDVIDEKYKIYTKEFDLSLNAKNLASKAELNFLRKKFENEYFENKRLINKLAKKLERLFSSLNINSWKFDQDEGYIDPTRLANLVANSGNLQIFKSKNENTEKNTIVSLLLDNSGSMRGKPIITSAITTEIITKVLEKCKVNIEILGFTTREWKGGMSKKKWESTGKVDSPGRLNDLSQNCFRSC